MITDGLYEIGEMEEIAPEGLCCAREDAQLPLNLLSMGTKDFTALSLRLAIVAEIFDSRKNFIFDG